MTQAEDMQLRLQLIKISREILNEEYINRRAEDHNAWLAAAESTWGIHKIRLPYPPFAKYPNEADIVARATIMYNFVNPQPNDKESYPELVKEPRTDEVPAPSTDNGLLPGWVRRSVHPTTGLPDIPQTIKS